MIAPNRIPDSRIRVLVVDDSAIVSKVLTEALSREADIEVVGTAPDPFIARDKILSLHPDVLTLDIEMPRMDGVTFLRKLMHHHPMPVIVISSLDTASSRAALDALEAGAIDVLAKPGGPQSVGDLRLSLASKIRAARVARLRTPSAVAAAPAAPPPRMPAGQPFPASAVIAVGASTGGTEAIQKVLTALPENCPGMVITQHIPAVFSRSFANRLNELCAIRVREAVDGDRVEPGLALIAPRQFPHAAETIAGRIPRGGERRPHGLLPAPRGRRAVPFRGAGGGTERYGRHPHRHGLGRSPGNAGDEEGGRPHHRPGRSDLRGVRHAERGDPPGRRRPGSAAGGYIRRAAGRCEALRGPVPLCPGSTEGQ